MCLFSLWVLSQPLGYNTTRISNNNKGFCFLLWVGFCPFLLGTQWQSLPEMLKSCPIKWTSFQIVCCVPLMPWWDQRAFGGERDPKPLPPAALMLFIRPEAKGPRHSNLTCAYVGQHLGQFYEVSLAGSEGLMLVFSWGLRILMNHVTLNRPGWWLLLGDPFAHPPPSGFPPWRSLSIPRRGDWSLRTNQGGGVRILKCPPLLSLGTDYYKC